MSIIIYKVFYVCMHGCVHEDMEVGQRNSLRCYLQECYVISLGEALSLA